MSRNSISYIYDTLCAWCMVASPVVRPLRDTIPDNIQFNSYHIQLFTPDHYYPKMDDEFITKVERVGTALGPNRTGVKFSDAYYKLLKSPGFKHNSYRTSFAIAATKQMKPQSVYQTSDGLQDMFFLEGIDPNKDTTYQILAAKIGLDPDAFLQEMHTQNSENIAHETATKGRAIVDENKLKGIPHLLLHVDDKTIKLDLFNLERTQEIIKEHIKD